MSGLYKKDGVYLRNETFEAPIRDEDRAAVKAADRHPHIEIGKAIIDATDKVREGLSKCESPSEINAYVDILAKIDKMHWKNTEKVMVSGR
jgi:hypothetical protein